MVKHGKTPPVKGDKVPWLVAISAAAGVFLTAAALYGLDRLVWRGKFAVPLDDWPKFALWYSLYVLWGMVCGAGMWAGKAKDRWYVFGFWIFVGGLAFELPRRYLSAPPWFTLLGWALGAILYLQYRLRAKREVS